MTKDQRAIDTSLNKLEDVKEEIEQKSLEGNEQIITWCEILAEQIEVIREAANLDTQ